jgi:trigger factor
MDLLRLQYLLKTQAEKTISEEERMELLQYLSAEENEELIKDIIGQVYQHPGEEIPMNEKTAQDMLQLILQSGETSAKLINMPRRNIGYRITVAAAVLLVIISAAWLLMEMVPRPETQHQAALSGDVKAPAVNKAMITLANGQRVYLDSVKNGQLALQGNIKLIKLTDGRIVYQTANGEVIKELQYNTLYNPRGSKVIDMALADGSRVWLNAGSSITYPVAFIGNERKVAVTGEAYFEVAHNASKPFVVTRGATIVQVLGTHFNVNAYEDEEDIKVTLLQGAVKVSNSNQSAVIKPGQQARLISDSKPEIRNDVNLEPEQVDEVLHELRRDGAPWNEPAEARAAAEGDMAYVDLEGFTTQGPLEEAMRENFPTIIGLARAGVPESVNNALVGMSAGDEKDVTDTLPDDYPNEELRGLDVTYHVTLRSIKEQQLPELDDEFAKKAGYDTVEALREAVDRNLRQRTEEAAETKQLDAVIEQLVAGSNIYVPDVMVNEELDSMLKNLEERVKQQFNIPLRRFLTLNGLTEEQWRDGEREHARERVLRTQALQEFARREGISVEEDEINSEVTQVLERFDENQREEVVKALDQHQMRHDLEDRIFQRKIVDRLTAIAEGRAEATPADAEAEAAPKSSRARKKGKAAAAEDEPQGDASDLAEAGGAAELLGTAGMDLDSDNETGDAPTGGTPTTAPGLTEK